MKKLYFLIAVLFAFGSVSGQVINIPDANFKAKLLTPYYVAKDLNGEYFIIDANNNSEIEESEALQVSSLRISNSSITSLIGISYFTNLKELICNNNFLVSLDVSSLLNLEKLDCEQNFLQSLNTTTLSNIKSINCGSNQLTELDLSAFLELEYFKGGGNHFSSFDFNGFEKLKELRVNGLEFLNLNGCISLEILYLGDCEFMQDLDVSDCTALKELDCREWMLPSIDLSGLVNLENASFENSQLESINLQGCSALERLFLIGSSQLTSIDVSYLPSLWLLDVRYSDNLESIYIKNGNLAVANFQYCPNLKYICADEGTIDYVIGLALSWGIDYEINSYCSFIPGGAFYSIKGMNKFDTESNGCTIEDGVIPNLKFNITGDDQTGRLVSDESGSFLIPVQAGIHTITPILENQTFFNISPSTISVTFPETTSPFTQNFCITPNGLHPDLEVTILPTTPARPGFDANYKLIIKNKGNIQQSGSVTFAYDDAVLDYIIANPVFTAQTEGSLSWAFADLQPFETREINVTLNVNSPMETPAVNGDDVLNYTATITSEQVDELPLDNTFTLPQIVVNSFDPNDKTCLEGTSILPTMIGQYVHYMIRFENTGTFAAQNIVVKDMIDTAKFDVSSLVALNGSHPYVTRITGNKVEFIFESINLPFDDANNDGYVVFKIKTLPTLALGDSFSNSASIYFDYNHPIVTEPAVTTFAELGTEDFVFNSYFTLYPNPTTGILNITTKEAITMQSISIYNVLGQMVVSVPNAKDIANIDVSSLSTGNYFIKVVSDRGTSNSKFVKK